MAKGGSRKVFSKHGSSFLMPKSAAGERQHLKLTYEEVKRLYAQVS